MSNTMALGREDLETTSSMSVWPYDYYTLPQAWTAPTGTYTPYFNVEPPRECSGDLHVFPCPHCDKCKCGAATVKRSKCKK